MKRKLILLVAALMAIGQNAFAYDFSAVAPSGQTLYYKIIDPTNHYVMLTHPSGPDEPWAYQCLWDDNSNIPMGPLVLPNTVTHNGITYTVRAVGERAFYKCPIFSVTMPNTVDSVGPYAFGECPYLTEITFSNTLRYIGSGAFCALNLGDVILPSSVRVLGNGAFGCSNITTITLNDSIEVLETDCLSGNKFTSIYIPASVRSITSPCRGSFGVRDYINSIVVDPNNPYYDSRDNCNAIINSTTGELVQACKNSTIPMGVYRVCSGALAGCSFGTLVIPNTVRFIEIDELCGDPGICHINKIVLSSPTIIANIHGNPFDTLQILNENPPSLAIRHLDNYECLTVVPCNSLTAYQSSSPWNQFTNMHEYEAPQITVNAEHGTATVLTYPTCTNDTATVSATTEEEHYHFVGWSDGSTQNPYTLVLNGNTSLTAIFAIDSALVDATSANPLLGTVMGGGVVALNETTTLTAIPTGDNVFLSWSNGVTNNPYTLTATTDTVLQAFFTLPDTIVLYDTVDVLVHDTTYVQVHDTTIEYVDHYIHDTVDVLVHDTIYMQVHDTTIEYVNHYIHDTTFVNNYIHDTMIQYVNHYIHDTTFVNNYVHDTVRITTQMFDTTIVNVYQFDTAIYNSYQYDTLFVNNHYYDTVFVHLHDTIYITEQGIGEVEGLNARVYSSHGQIVVEGADGNMVTLYDITGRVLETKQDDYTPLRFDAPVSGTYMIKIGKYPARKVVVIR